jgi:protein phosphatase
MAITARRSEVKPHISEEKLEPQDVILLCSDGLWGVVPETLISAAATELQPQVAADKLVALANNSRGPDNISVIVARQVNMARRTANLEDTDS